MQLHTDTDIDNDILQQTGLLCCPLTSFARSSGAETTEQLSKRKQIQKLVQVDWIQLQIYH